MNVLLQHKYVCECIVLVRPVYRKVATTRIRASSEWYINRDPSRMIFGVCSEDEVCVDPHFPSGNVRDVKDVSSLVRIVQYNTLQPLLTSELSYSPICHHV